MSARRLAKVDALLLLMTLIWGTNYSIVKHAFREVNPQAFNAARMTLASAIFLLFILVIRRVGARSAAADSSARRAGVASIFYTPERITRADWLSLAGLGVVGHFLYQYFFIGGLSRTSIANSSLLLATTPVVIALVAAALGHDRISPLHWAGAVLSMLGIYVVVGTGPSIGGAQATGDLMMMGAVVCWAIYTIGARRIITRHSPVGVTGISMIVGTLLYVPAVGRDVAAAAWGDVSAETWVALVYSSVFALCVAYTIWYAAVREIGSARTSVYSNLVPLAAMLTAVVFLEEPLAASKLVGAGAVLVGVALTRAGRQGLAIPAEE